MSSNKLFEPIKVGDVTLTHRVVLAPLTRYKATAAHVPTVPLISKYYSQRGSTPGTLLITEGTFITGKAGGYGNVPGIWNEEQIAAWKEIVAAVHAKGSFIFLQLWALGRAAVAAVLKAEDPSFDLVSASAVAHAEYGTPRELTLDEVKEYIQLFAKGAANAVHGAGFDGVEIHAANGYLVDQFFQDVTNKRTDAYGGSVENRARFALDIIDAVVDAVGESKTAIRMSPWSRFNEMRMADPKPTFSYFVSSLASKHPNLAYIHVVEPRVFGNRDLEAEPPAEESNDFLREIWAPRPFIAAGGFTRDRAIAQANAKGDLIAFGRHYIPNPDLPARLEKNIALTPYDRAMFYIPGDFSGKGYTDYPFAT